MPGLTRGATVLFVVLFSACGDSGTGPDTLNCSGGAALVLGTTLNGTLAEGDDLDVDGAFLDRYALAVPDAGLIRITMRSDDVDAWLWLLSSTGSVLESDDDSGGDLDARIERTLSRGCYLVEATSASPGQVGAYSLLAERR